MRNKRRVPLKNNLRYAIVVDGECEFWYMQMLKRNEKGLNINLEPRIPQKKSLSEQKELIIELSKHYDKVFWIIDFDVILKETRETNKGEKTPLTEFKEFYKKIAGDDDYKSRVNFVINNPCLELWFLYHFEYTTRYFTSCEKVIDQLKKNKTIGNYSKTQKYFTKQNADIYLKLKPYLSTAISNAQKLKEVDFDNLESGFTQMNIFFETEELKKLLEA